MQPTFADLQPAPPDSILGLAEQFKADSRSHKISLASGVYVDESGTTPVLQTVREAEQRILDALAWLASIRPDDPADKTQVALLAGQSPASSGYQNNLGSLRSLGLIDYPRPGMVQLTDAGHGAARAPARAPTTGDLHRTLEAKLPRPLWAILEYLISIYPADADKDHVAVAIGVSAASSGYQNNLGRLRSLGFIDYPRPGRVVARPELFLEDRP